jgi:hypothetical protein
LTVQIGREINLYQTEVGRTGVEEKLSVPQVERPTLEIG